MLTVLPELVVSCTTTTPNTPPSWSALSKAFQDALNNPSGRECLVTLCRDIQNQVEEIPKFLPWEKLFLESDAILIRVEENPGSDVMQRDLTLCWADRSALRAFVEPLMTEEIRKEEERSWLLRFGTWSLNALGMTQEAASTLKELRNDEIQRRRRAAEPAIVHIVLSRAVLILIEFGKCLGQFVKNEAEKENEEVANSSPVKRPRP